MRKSSDLRGGVQLLDQNQPSFGSNCLVTLDNYRRIAWPCAGDISFKCLTYQLTMVRDMPTMVITGNGE